MITLKKICLLFTVLLLLSGALIARDYPNTILWKVSDKAGHKSGYLLGTIHLSNDDVFNLPDSVLPALMQCDAVALELHPDSISDMVMSEIKNRKDKTSRRVIDILSKSELKKVKKLFKNIEGWDDNSIEGATAFELVSAYQYNRLKAGKMNTFLDGFIFDIGRSNGKIIIGLERADEHTDAITSLDEKDEHTMLVDMTKKGMGEYLDTILIDYINQDLNKISVSMLKMSDGAIDGLLIKRNLKMADRIDSILFSKSLFVAVGTAHLPGNDGLIDLLEKKGYKVTPVISVRNSNSISHINNSYKGDWLVVRDEPNGLLFNMPAQPSDMNFGPVVLKGYYDIGKGNLFMAGGMSISEEKLSLSFKELTQSIMNNYSASGKAYDSVFFEYQGDSASQFSLAMEKFNGYCRLVKHDGMLCLMALASMSSFPDSAMSKYFFNTLGFYTPVETENVFVSDSAGFTFKSNFKLTALGDRTTVNTSSTRNFSANHKGSYFYISVIDYPAGYMFNDYKSVFSSMAVEVQKSLKIEADTTYYDIVDRCPAMITSLTHKDGSVMIVEYLLRGSRLYYYLYTISDIRNTDRFALLKMLQMIPYKYMEYSKIKIDEYHLTINLPQEPEADTTVTQPLYSFHSQDPYTGYTFSINASVISPYEFAKSDSVALVNELNEYIASDDSVVRRKYFVNENKVKFCLAEILPAKNPYMTKYYATTWNAGNMFLIYTALPSDSLSPKIAEKYFASVAFDQSENNFSFSSSKAEKLLSDLSSDNDSIRNLAGEALEDYEWTEGDTTLLRAAVDKVYPGDNTNYFRFVNGKILAQLLAQYSDSRLITFVNTEYDKLTHPHLRYKLVATLGSRKDSLCVITFLNIMLDPARRPQIKTDYPYSIFSNDANDSVSYSQLLYPKILGLLNDEVYKESVYDLTVKLIFRNKISNNVIDSYYETIISDAERVYAKDINGSKNSYLPGYGSDCLALASFHDKDERYTSLFNKVSRKPEQYTARYAYSYLAKNEIPIDQKSFEKYLMKPTWRGYLYEQFEKENLLSFIPEKFRTQNALAEGDIWNVLSDDYSPDIVEFISERTISNDSASVKYYLYRVGYEDGKTKNSYLGVAGPYAANGKLSTSGLATGITDELLDEANIDEQFKQYIEQF
jgi:uncharacterized protein YbaP (TraB family)